MTSQLIGPLYTNVTYLGVCVVSTISSYDILVDWSSVHKHDIPWCVCVLSVLYPRMTSQLIGPLYTNVTYLGVCVLSVLYPRMTSQLIGPLYTNVTCLGVCVLSVLYPRMASQLIGPLYTNVTYLGVCVVSTISSYDISSVDWSSVYKRDIPWCVCVVSTISSYDISSVDWSSVYKRDIPWCVCCQYYILV